ncbi:MAG: potassium transporter Kup [Acidobacteria bacterium]|nr:potassium transporter Kup [Acidobacteriota bacterium]
MAPQPAHRSSPRGRYLATLCLVALGVVYGDIGTSPLYAIRECFYGPHAVAPTPAHVLGVLSLVFWALVIVISIKYLVVVLRADNQGEGGILSLTALATPIKPTGRHERSTLVLVGIFGAALLYGDGLITPAISVLGAMEGLSVATPVLQPFVVPITIAILVALFLFQSRGTAGVGKVFGPVTLLWFAVLALLGVIQIARVPSVLAAVNPVHGVRFFLDTGWQGYLVLGSVFLVVTGGEALYADMGHFGTRPIRLDWFAVVLPALLLNYFGQGALLLERPDAAENPFYLLAPAWAIFPMIVLAVAAAIIASQAVISGAYSLTMQAVQLGFSPRIRIDHTSTREYGQIYIGGVNWALMAGCILIVLAFGTSSNLAAAYGVAVTSTMVITTVLLYVVARDRWRWGALTAGGVAAVFLVVDLAFFGANIIKVAQGGWMPLALAAAVYLVMTTWKGGRRILAERIQAEARPLTEFLQETQRQGVTRVPGTAIFMNGTASKTPAALRHNLEHNKVLHERAVFVTVKTQQVPHVPSRERLEVEDFGSGLYRVKVYYGFMEEPNIPQALAGAAERLGRFDPRDATYFLGRETIIATRRRRGMAVWRERLFALMSRNATTATAYFGIPPDRVVELGEQIEI